MMHTLRKHSSILAKMKIFLPLVVWIILLFRTTNAQLSASRKHVGIFGLKHEVFFLNLEDGYFGCQVNESTDYLQLYELSKLCDGTSDCYMGSDELRNKLKCTNDCDKDGTACSNGVCLDGQCHCNDGFGGCNCQVPDENECKYRPCDVFAHCTNTLGSFTCTCFPGYQGDGLHCEDIDECQDPNIAQRCVENAECCNLPAHFVCKCKPGFEGDGEERCADINECLDPQACGLNAECVNLPGNYTCQCREGYYGDPYNGCIDVDECVQPGVCGPGAICTNLEGGYRCDCPQGFDGDARSAQGCLDYDECARSPCGRNALCRNEVGSFRCECQQGFSGDPMTDCQAACSETDECNQDEVCSNGQCINPCHEVNACGMNAECLMGAHTKQCSCPAGFTGDPAVECVRVPISCASSTDCVDGSICKESMCLPRCRNDQECALNEKCLQGSCMLTCRLDNDCFLGHICLTGRCVYGCHADSDCSASETCRDNRCVNPCSENPCGPNAACTVVNHRASCSCFNGMVPSPTAKVGCVRAPALQCSENRDCADGTSCIDRLCRPVCGNDQGCLNNERCDGGSCKPICRKDDDCRTGEICQGQTCMIGCRSDSGCSDHLACIGQQCVDPCQEPTACGTNAECVVVSHKKQCSCPGGLVGDPFNLGCRQETHLCQTRTDCPKGQACYGGTCMQTCRNDQNCLADERCVRGTCRTVCNSDAACGNGLICEGRICQAGCRSDNQCATNQACINKKCTDPCGTLGQCGSCSECTVIDHGVQCSCPHGYLGNPLLSCSPPAEKCNAQCSCDEDGMYCVKSCRQTKDCGCGQTCHRGKCRTKCSPGNCPAGLLCQNGACVAGCRTSADCPSDRSCTNGKCVDPCADSKACGKNALCQVSDHRSLCLCPDGFQGDPSVGCAQYECQTNDDCELDKKCASGKCINPCLIPGACGLNAQCRVVNRQAQCSCTPGFFGNARQECQPVQKKSCAQNPCGDNTVCREDEQGYECSCQPGCVGDPRQGCLCEGKLKKDDCEQYACGTNAVCRMTDWGAPSCVCLPTHPYGDPYMSCTQDDTAIDCRTTGCVEGECVRDGAKFICRKDESCANDLQCANDKACIGGKCSDPCSLRGACGDNALCQTVLHRPRCSCPNCYIGRPNVECKPDPKCEEVTTPRPNDPKIVSVACETNDDCHESLRCDASGQCSDPCTVPAPFVCDANKKCVSRRHRPSCVCTHGFIVNDSGELVCAPEKRECFGDDGCASNMACLEGRCLNPCFGNGKRSAPCPDDKACVVVDHRPTCVCMKDCSPSLSICLRDSGCPDELACRNYQCVNPCETTTCAEDTPCYVEDHKPICKFCPPGFVKDVRHGCLKELGCRHSNECPLERSCINGICVDPCRSGNPCDVGEECEVQNHETVCVKLCQCEKAADCGRGLLCDGCNCVQKDTDRTTGCEHCPPGIPCDPITGGCVKEPPGSPKIPEPCQSDNDCLDNEACYMGLCENPCLFDGVCAETATCQAKMHRPICTCPPGLEGNPTIKCTVLEPIQCTTNDECSLTEACVGNVCHRPCDVKNPCTTNAVCINTNHGTDCSCIDGYHGNGFVQCIPVTTVGSVCQYNEDCPPDKLCDRLNRVCINPCQSDSCGDNADCYPVNHGIDCRCKPGYAGNAYIECTQPQGCLSDRQCNDNEACVNGRCASPCQCGPNAMCDVKKHKAICRCPPGYGGNARIGCNPPSNPCDPNPCGINAMCEIDNGNPVCFCPRGLTGNPFKNCIPEGDECTPNPCGPNSGCRKINGKATCFCLPEFEGNPPHTACTLPQNPCVPSPCGPNTQCTILSNGYAKCTCVPGYIESPNTIRGCVEPSSPCDPNPCGFGAICDATRNPVCYCPDSMIGNPYRSCFEPVMTPELCQPGPCGANSDCYVAEGREQCYCKSNFIGDPYGGCVEQPKSVCEPNPCAPGAECVLLVDGSPGCRCPPGLSGDPTTTGCHAFECLNDDQCVADKACIGLRCSDPCPGSCGTGAHCRVEKHHPVCFCDAGLTGNPAIQCYSLDERPRDACNPSPCGANARCSMRNKRPVCKCLTNYHGDPRKGCKPECDINSDCTPDKSCVNHKCVSPCALGTVCGVNAECSVNYHTPMCKCPSGYTGDAFVQCVPIPEDRNMTRQPCLSDPCGPGEICSIYGNDVALCDPCVAPDAIHNPRCRPQCVLNTDCPFNMACLQSQCQDPCPGSCGYNALCTVERHRPVCYCPPNMHGNPYEQCNPQESPRETCDSIRCGANTQCKQQNGVLACVCKKNYYGDPLVGCRPECVLNTDCPISKACVNSRCVDPCVDACGVNAQCKVVNHLPICYCPPTHTGDALVACTERTYLPPDNTPCDPNPCGPNSKCRSTPDGYAICSCLPGYRGVPPACQAECMINAECPQNKACINLKCADPCPGTCGVGARCEVLNHNPICSCGANQQGDPFVICESRQNEPPKEQRNPCDPSPCGPNSLCQVRGRRPVCSCQPNFIGSPPACRPECVLSSECPQDKACINEKCQNPCANACGANADCHIVAHSAFCSCRAGFEGDAFIGCSAVPKDTPRDVCYPNPCAENAICSEHNGAAKCTCITPYLGDPYNTGCRPECVLNSDCPSQAACVNQHCRDPCPGVCGTNADCTVANHIPVCECSRGYVGDPFRGCRKDIPPPVAPKDPCASCPSNSVCRVVGGRPTCSCAEGYRGTPPACRPECSSNEECSHDRSCINLKCKDPCPGLCGINAQCQVINHKPFCSCQRDMIGNPFDQCYPKPAEPIHPCQPSPCGAYSECREIDNRAVCTCAAGMLGAPPNCRPECETDQDCPSNRACFNQKCRDPCVGSCGYNAECVARNHRPECYCANGFEGDPYSGCNPVVVQEETPMPCNPSPCGANAICKERNGAGSCACAPEYFGDPYVGCRPECVMNSDCPRTRACINNKCQDPCPGTCGVNAECHVANHSPSCVCLAGLIGNPFTECRPKPEIRDEPVVQPCQPSPCGPNSVCRVLNNHAVCTCQQNFIGSPPNCRPECVVSSECSLDKSCVKTKCTDPCPGTCGFNARCQVVNHNPICSCKAGFTGDPFVRCVPEERRPVVQETPADPCIPSPCGPNSQCKAVGHTAACSCLPNYIGRAPNCRPECTSNSQCTPMKACINERCGDPCPGSCGSNALCTVQNHQPNCRCTEGYEGDPYTSCALVIIYREPEIVDPCNPSPCGINADCNVRNNAGSCTCVKDYFGDPYHECRPECMLSSDCANTRACLNNKCVDPCPGMCGLNAECFVMNHSPSCACLPGYTGNPSQACREIPKQIEHTPIDPCRPSPCGPYSQCRNVNDHAVCSCQAQYIGTPPACRPECTVSSECALDKACIKQSCLDPCPGTCGFNARCTVINHNPICSCPSGFTGDPFERCVPEEKQVVQAEPTNPCIPSPCGPNSQCRAVGNVPACSCLPNYVGRAPNCRPECTINAECAGNLACMNEKCADPCPGSCGPNAVCHVIEHSPTCSCQTGYTGDPFSGCTVIPLTPVREEPRNPCNPSPCGSNAVCKERNGAGSCTCLPDYFGDPYSGCRPECVTNSDCPRVRACVNNKCADPCPGACGIDAECYVANHSPSCACRPGYTGDPFTQCRPPEQPKQNEPINPCSPSPCGPNSICRESNGHAVCTCQSSFIGTPPNCRPECIVSSECALDKACIGQKCNDPCPGTCGQNARCQVVNHNPICSCSLGFTGDPFVRCVPVEKAPVVQDPIDPCVPSPCGPNSVCRAIGTTPACSCLPNYIGRAPNCRPECMLNAECPATLACVNERCTNPCVGSCGINARCTVVKHNPICECETGFTGDPFSVCTEIIPNIRDEEPVNPCNPSPCGANAICKERNGAGSCTCMPEYFGDPYTGCRPECVQNTDCEKSKACMNNKCLDPCPGVCGLNAECVVQNHSPVCYCLEGYTGDPASVCTLAEIVTERPKLPGCQPSPCGPNSQCREINGHPVCSCLAGYIGTPPMCRPECVVSSECSQDRACVNKKCVDPCPGTCGTDARCQVVNHNPICSCPPGFTGDPFIQCAKKEEQKDIAHVNPCVPSPCGPNANCRTVGSQPACSCAPNYIGRPPNCRPECTRDAECPSNLACQNERCIDPCAAGCGLNAVCRVINHKPVCTCDVGFEGNPLEQCSRILPPTTERLTPCTPSPCGPNAECRERNNAGACYCLAGYEGNPYDVFSGCRRECDVNSDCSDKLACVQYKCVDPCPGVCGAQALCEIHNHVPTCICPENMVGDPFVQCNLRMADPITPAPPVCDKFTCGPNSICRIQNGVAVCKCQPDMVGSPPNCRPECQQNSDCEASRACVNFRCIDPCPGSCGQNANCNIINHNPICSCTPGFTGDPFTRCYKEIVTISTTEAPRALCTPSPCGPNAECKVVGDREACSCLPGYIGAPPSCRPECILSTECADHQACIRQKCTDPCPGSCGLNAKCSVSRHTPSCSCDAGFTGDPFTGCQAIIVTKPPPQAEPRDPCYPSPCGVNARCRPANGGTAVCECIENYFGNPYETCRPECVGNGDCQKSLACINNRCKDPCPGVCGRNAECSVVNHTPVCSCPEGMKGNAFEQCLREEVPPPSDPCYPSPCGQNTICRVSNGNAVCECLPEFRGSPFGRGCYPECVINSDCPRDRTCVNKKCVDPCPGVCGYRAECHAINNSPVCSCPRNMIGDPFVECKIAAPKDPCNPSPCRTNGICRVVGDRAECQYPECIINSDCSTNRACYNQRCQDPCVGACGINALCSVINHSPVCSCPARHAGSPFVQCMPQRDEPLQPQLECTNDNQCTNDKACINEQCQNPCTIGTGLCTQNAECRVQFHRAICACREGYTGNAQLACYEVGCRSDSDCPVTEACVNKNCIDPCRHTQCGRNAFCKSDYNHNARCHCMDGYRGNPLVGCTRPECTTNDECPYHQSCQNEQCRDPCNCAPNAQCRVDNHQANCRCPPGYTGDPQFSCEKIPVRDPAQCTMDADCSSKLACFGGVCKNPCTETKPCAEHAVCTVQDTLPLRTMYCVCEEGYAGDAERQCLPVSKDEPGCYSDVECSPTESCRARVCVDVCSNYNPCAPTAECLAQSHKAICSCPVGTVGDPFQNCYKPPVVSPECVVDADCSSSMACVNERCQDPCAESNPCGGNAECRAIYHRPHCTCPIGWGGDPKTQCYKPECKTDTECPFDKACFNEKCISPCTYGATQCGRGASCVAQSHRAVCICPPGTQGNPFVSCVTGMCQYNEDCAEHEACDRLNRVCRPVCEDETCARTATCVAKNHQASCECAPGMRGNPYVECLRDEPEPECRMDSECGSQQACIRNRCVNPCAELTPCTNQQICNVIDTLPLRTIICACQTDMLMDRSGSCKPIVIDECRLDNDCADTERCVRGQCITACKADPCGINAQCTSANHRAQCTCSPGYVGNAHIECLPEPRVTSPKECVVDDDCSDDRSCINDRCINPCVNDACGRGALCRANKHQAVCNCPAGYTMDGNGNCIPPAGDLPRCRSNSDCTRSETCVNEICANPCNCGQNADCFVKDHYPVCSCRPGYSGNAQTGCFKLECQSDNDCTNDKQCTNGACVDPCLYQNPCALNAQCYGDRHQAACRCLPGLEGDPFERCRRVECHYDGECAQTLACQQEQCVDPCANSPCAQNAQCFVINHLAQCKCPEQMPEGNPYSFCRPRAVEREECRVDGDCPSRLACIGNRCVNPCDELKPCGASALCTVQDSVPVRTMVCECPAMHVPDSAGECKRIVLQTPVGVCTTDSECPAKEACINRQCRDPCSCGTNAICSIKNHRAVCSCEDGYEGNPNIACRAIGCRVDSECETSKACVNGNCVNPCLDHDPCGIGAECFGRANRAECRCLSGFRGNPLVQCNVVECRSNNDCPDDKQCRNSQCVNPCIYENSCSARAECRAQNHLVVCRCPVGLVGNPYVDCRPEIVPECQYDTDCPSHLACIDNKCTEPCNALTPCNQPARCEVVPSSPVRTMLCTCPDGYVSSGSGTCKPVVKAGCISDSDCSSDTACINSICRDPCNCGPNAECRVKDHKPVCSCAQGYDGDPETQCIKIECRSDSDCSGQHTCYNRQCVPACSMESCGTQAECIGINHRAVCECVPGYEGNPKVACKLIGCRRDSDCPLDKACINGKCENPCELQAVCAQNEQCQVYQHRPECACPPPFENDPLQGCVLRDDRCMTDGECPSQTACIQGECVNPCNVTEPCGVNSNCKVLDTLPVRTMICECLPGYQGNAAIQCDKMALCPTDRGFVRNSNGECVCPPGYGLSLYDDCQPCREEDGLKIDETGRCVCALERGLIIDERGRCICPIEYGYRLTSRGECVRSEKPECERDEHCADWRYCNLESKTCDDPCQRKICGTNALCNATNHQAVCQCITGYTGNPEEHCNQTTNFRTDFPQPEMVVTCQADGVQVVIDLAESNFNGVLYVKGHSKDEECRRVVNLAGDTSSARTQIFKVHFGSCGLIHVNGIASFVLVIQKHPKLVTYKAQAYHIKCVYQTGEQNVTLGFNVQMLTTAGTIANTGPPPTCAMRIVAFNGEEINSAEIGDNLRLQVEVQPATIYGGFARSCVAKTMEESVENEYIVTDEDGCATDPSIFGDWEYNAETNSLLASFNAFKFPSSDNIRFQCNIRVCFGKCQPVNCHGANAYGKRRRRRETLGIDMMRTIEVVYNRTRRAADDTALATDDSLGVEGTLREEITIQSNAILTLEKREERSFDSNNITPAAQRVEDICVSMIGLILALVITALLALVAVAVAVSCWLMAYRRRPTITGPLPHPPEFPNPLFAHHEPSEPSHHDFMG